jgi:adenine-specific DNA-methyltransferase
LLISCSSVQAVDATKRFNWTFGSQSRNMPLDGDDVVRGFVPTPPQIVDEMIGRLFRQRPPDRSDTVLDPGCGTGAFLEGIIRWCKRHRAVLPRMVGIESEPRRVKAARENFRSINVEIRQSDFLTAPVESFDFIIGNPPYVSILGLSEAEKREFRANYETARGRFDLYILFFERAIKSLKPDGRMVFITPEKFLYVETAAPLRRLLSKIQVEEIELIDERAFDGLVTYPTITTLVNQPASKTTVIRMRDGVKRQCTLDGQGRSWTPLVRGASKQRLDHATLKDVCVRISCGVATGADDVFVVNKKDLNRELAEFAKPTISGRELTASENIGPSKCSMLIPYAKDGTLLKEEELEGFGDYLRQGPIRKRLLERTCVRRKPWYAFHETPPLSGILRPKILCKDLAERPHFWIDRHGIFVPRHSVYYIVPKDTAIIDCLCDYLNSSDISLWLSEHCQRAANSFLRLQSNILKAIPIPEELRTSPTSKLSARHLELSPRPAAARPSL